MTAVIGILNKSAVAIAADSAATVAGPRGTKVFNRANKIFRLCQGYPLGMMIYNHSEFMGTPWEIIVKTYRKEQGTQPFDTVELFRDNFLNFLHNKNFFCAPQQQKKTIHIFLISILQFFAQRSFERLQVILQNPPPGTNVGQLMSNMILADLNTEIASLEADTDYAPEFANFTENEFDAIGFTGINQAIQQVLTSQGVPVDVNAYTIALKRLLFLAIRSKRSYNFYSGLVFTGYGEAEYFPSLHAINISLAINNRLRYFKEENRRAIITHDMQSAIRPFAQTDVINTVLSGIDQQLNNYFILQFKDFFHKHNETIAQLVEPHNANIAASIRNINAGTVAQTLQAEIAKEQRRIYTEPLMRAVITLSKEDLVEMAESLIYLTYLKRRFTFAEESVGGPVDVVVITKGDGFVWIKRKHYFEPSLNNHFLRNYV
jgi:hypothetical protein